jgi:hypothetical protein
MADKSGNTVKANDPAAQAAQLAANANAQCPSADYQDSSKIPAGCRRFEIDYDYEAYLIDTVCHKVVASSAWGYKLIVNLDSTPPLRQENYGPCRIPSR